MLHPLQHMMDRLGGMSSDEIRDWCVREGIKGNKRHCCACPLAKLLGRMTGELVQVDNRDVTCPTVRVALPASARQFVRNFDRGQYPELEN